MRWSGDDVLQPGAWTGNVGVSSAGSDLTLRGDASAAGVRIKLPPSLGGAGEFGAPVAVHLVWEAVRGDRSIDVSALNADLGGLAIEVRGRVDGLGPDAVIEAEVSAHTDLGAAFQATGIRLPVSMDVAPTDRLGTASGELAIRGPLWRPAELMLTPELKFESTPGGIEKLQFLNRPFRYEPPAPASIECARARRLVSIAAVPRCSCRAPALRGRGLHGSPCWTGGDPRAAWRTTRSAAPRPRRLPLTHSSQNLFLSRRKATPEWGGRAGAAVDARFDAAHPGDYERDRGGPGLTGGPRGADYFAAAARSSRRDRRPGCLIPARCGINSAQRRHPAGDLTAHGNCSRSCAPSTPSGRGLLRRLEKTGRARSRSGS